MLSLSTLIILSLPLLYALHTAWSLYKNIQIAKASGIRYVVVPFYLLNRVWMIFGGPILKVVDKLPAKWSASWRRVVEVDWAWNYRHEPFVKLGTDTFLTVAPAGLFLYTADPEVIIQVTTRRADFPKPIEIYRITDIYGKNVVSTEGAEWRHHRKLTSPPFTEKNNQVVWKETLRQTQGMLELWAGPAGGAGQNTIRSVADDTMRLSLHVISRAAFNREMEWPKSRDSTQDPFANDKAPEGHTMSFTYSMHYLLANVLPIILLPTWFLRYSPFQTLRKGHEAYNEWGKYMQENVAEKKAAIIDGTSKTSTIDLLGQLVRGQVEVGKENMTSKAALSDSEVMGNSFVFTLAGHETTANSIHFSLLLLALNPDVQRSVQTELVDIFQDRPASEWDYERDLPRLFGGMVGAVMNEELRLMPPVTGIPKSVCSTPQTLIVEGKKVTAPANIMFNLCATSVHRHPKYWPHGPSKNPRKGFWPPCNIDNDLEEFKPQRWLKTGNDLSSASAPSMPTDSDKTSDTESLGVNTAPDTAPTLFTPVKGSFIPFSEGYRACLGRRFAQVEILAALAVILTQYSLELAVDEWASDEEVERMSKEEKLTIWRKAEERANYIWQEKTASIITLQIRGDNIPFRLARKGEERFAGLW